MTKDLRRAFALMRDKGILYCAICGCLIAKKDQITVDHWVPKSKAGPTNGSNLLPAHKVCNEIKSDLMPDEFRRHRVERFAYALAKYNLSRKDRQIIKNALISWENSK